MLSTGCMTFFVGGRVKSFGGDEEALDDEENDDHSEYADRADDELDEEDVVEDVSDSESFPSEGLVAFRFKDGNTVDSRTDRPRIGNAGLWDLLRFRWRVILDSHSIWEQGVKID
jgi:hypothetical protein